MEQVKGRTFSPHDGERKALRKRARFRPSKWAERYRVLPPKVSSMPGKWRNSNSPYLAGIMDAAAKPYVRTIIACKSPQIGMTEAVHNFMGYTIDRDPGQILYVFPDEDMARENMRDRIAPMVSSTPQLRKYLTRSSHDSQSLRLDLRHVNVYLAWARSASKLGNKPIRFLSLDEVDKYPDTAGRKESSPIALAEARTTTYSRSCKIFKYSTPTMESGNIWQAINNEAELVFHFEVRCPDCGKKQRMIFDQIKWEGGSKADPKKVYAWYECAHCGSEWDDDKRDAAVRRGVWRDNDSRSLDYALGQDRPAAIGFHLPAWLSKFVSLSKCAAAFIKGQRSKTALKNFMNNFAAEPWVEYEVEREEDQILALRDDRPVGLVPGEGQVACLVGQIDTQDNGFWYEIRAFGWGHIQESWQIRSGFIPADWSKISREQLRDRQWPYHPAFDPIREILWENEYKDAEGNIYSVRFAGIDAMGHHTSQVYDFCRAHRGKIVPLQGMTGRSNTAYKWSKIDTYPGTNKPISGGIKLLQLDVHHYKDELSSRLQIAPLDPGAWHLCADADRFWAQQMCAEYVDDKGRWQCPTNKDNHAWDCSVYGLALADVLGIKHWRHPDRNPEQEKSARQKKKQTVNPFTQGVNPFQR